MAAPNRSGHPDFSWDPHTDLVPHYQPLLDLQGGHLGAEALARWQRGGVTIPVREAFASLSPLEVTLAAAAPSILQYADRGGRGAVSVNVSPTALVDTRFLDDLARARDHSGVQVVVELTEDAPLLSGTVAAAASRLRREGFMLAVDDFGDGYATPAAVRALAPDIVKVSGIVWASEDPAGLIAEAVAVHSECVSSPAVLVEGIERMEQALLAASAGARLLQGFLIARPTPDLSQYQWEDTPVHGSVNAAAPVQDSAGRRIAVRTAPATAVPERVIRDSGR